eukprot:scaffold88058_cov60-Phaeocystis_antarctica.AAC.4
MQTTLTRPVAGAADGRAPSPAHGTNGPVRRRSGPECTMSQTHAVLSLTTVRRNDCALEELCGADTCAGQLYIFRIQRRTRTRGGDGRKGGMEIEARVARRAS